MLTKPCGSIVYCLPSFVLCYILHRYLIEHILYLHEDEIDDEADVGQNRALKVDDR